MSNVNIRRAVDNIRSGTNVYTPLVETIVNAIQAIEDGSPENGRVEILVKRSKQQEFDGGQPPVDTFTVIDNGIGFNDDNRDSFDTLYSDRKIAQGGKGFGRFICLKYFDDLLIESVFEHEEGRKKRTFKMGKQTDIIINEKVMDCPDAKVGSCVTIQKLKRSFPDKKIETMARTLVERLLPYFIDADYKCPDIEISEEDGAAKIVLNNFFNNQLASMIRAFPERRESRGDSQRGGGVIQSTRSR